MTDTKGVFKLNIKLSENKLFIRTVALLMMGQLFLGLNFILFSGNVWAAEKKLFVVATLPDYAWFAQQIGGDKAVVHRIAEPHQDAHFIRPKPSFIKMLRRADMLVATGLDLEMWLPGVIDKSGNMKIRSGKNGYVTASAGVDLKEIPHTMSRVNGGLHIYGNPHITTGPLNMIQAVKNIARGYKKIMPEMSSYFAENEKKLINDFYNKLFGKELVKILGSKVLVKLIKAQKLYTFLETKMFEARPLMEKAGGWIKKALPLRNKQIVTYHKNWKYFFDTFEIIEGGFIEPKPGIPPSPRHISILRKKMLKENIKVILSADYFDKQTAYSLADRVSGKAIRVPYYSGSKGSETYFKLVDLWIDSLLNSVAETAE